MYILMEFRPNRVQQTKGRQFHQHLKTHYYYFCYLILISVYISTAVPFKVHRLVFAWMSVSAYKWFGAKQILWHSHCSYCCYIDSKISGRDIVTIQHFRRIWNEIYCSKKWPDIRPTETRYLLHP